MRCPPLPVVFLVGSLPWASPAAELGVAPATRKLLPEAPFPCETTAVVMAAKGEWEGFQIAVRDPAGLAAVDVSLSDLAGPGGAAIDAGEARLYREHFVDVVNASDFGVTYHEREEGLYPDPLIPFDDPYTGEPVGAPFDLGPAELGVVWVDLFIPRNAEPGEYTGTASVTVGGQTEAELPVSLTVWAFEIPAERTVATAFRYVSDSSARKFHGGPDAEAAEGFDEILERYHLALHEHRIDPTDVYGPLEFHFDDDGDLEPVDWTAYDEEVAPWLDGTRFADGVGVRRFSMGYFRPGSGLGSMTEDEYAQAAVAFADHLEEKNWWDRAYIYASDEPWLHDPDEDYGQIAADGDRLIAADPRWRYKTLVTSPFDERVVDRIGIWCPVTPMYDGWWWVWDPHAGWDVYTERLDLGEELWFYACNANTPPYAGYDIDTAIGYEPRIVKWGTWYERATGFLYWRVSYWVDDDPWHVFLNIDQFGETTARNGDGLLLYPGDHDGTAGGKGSPDWLTLDGPILSYRLKQIRDGLEDWEMFRLAVDLGAEDFTRAQVERAYTRFGDFFLEDCDHELYYCPEEQPWTLDEAVLADARAQVAAKIQHLLDPDTYPDPEAADGDDDDSAASGDDDDSAPRNANPDDCSCRVTPGAHPPPMAMIVVAALGWIHRRRGGRA